jgi:hypothetical protein
MRLGLPDGGLAAQVTPADVLRDMRNACQGRATCSEADFYSGTFDWNEELTSEIVGRDNRSTSSRKVVVHMVISSGRVQCTGTLSDESKAWTAGKLTTDARTTGTINGPGLFRIEFDKGGSHSIMGAAENEDVDLDPNQPSYRVAVTCPSPEATHTGGGETSVTPSQPARWGSSEERETYDWPGSFTERTLAGRSTYFHPDADPANGVRGTVTLSWSLTKAASPKP